jgi:Uma2 family endonuclease
MEQNTSFEEEITESEYNSFHRLTSRNHSLIQTRIARALDVAYEQDYSILTAVDLELPTGKAVPDVSIYPKLTILDWEQDIIKMQDPPITAIEIISPRQPIADLTDKNREIYFPSGVKSVWLVIPAFGEIKVILPNKQSKTFSSGILKDPVTGIEISLDDVFKK